MQGFGPAPGLLAAFGAGLLSFLSPCVLPLIPGYLSFVSGYGLAEIRGGLGRNRILARGAAFSSGFSLVFVVLSLVFSGGALALGGATRTISLVAGLVVVALGLNLMLDLVKVLDLEARFHPRKAPRGLGGAFVTGLAFGAGWSPCVGPILASILLLAAREGDLGRSALLLGSYSLGLALPFLAAGLFFDRLGPLVAWFGKRGRQVRLASGAMLVLIGAAMALGRLALVNSLAARAGFALREFSLASPGAARATGAASWLLVAALVILPALARGHRRPSTARVALTLAFAALAALEAAGVLSLVSMLAGWLLFQGA